MAPRFGALPDSAATARLLGISCRLLLAAPSYLARAGTPQTPADPPAHAVIAGPMRTGPNAWSFEKEGRRLSVRVEGRLTVSAHEGAMAATVAGLGIMPTGHWSCRAELAGASWYRCRLAGIWDRCRCMRCLPPAVPPSRRHAR